MKLLRVKLLGRNFRSLPANKDYVFNQSFESDRLSSKVLAGVNGSGKSNFLEVLAEIFYFCEIYHLYKLEKKKKYDLGFGFEIEYLLPIEKIISARGEVKFQKKWCHVRIIKLVDEDPEYSFKNFEDNEFERLDEKTQQLLPSKIIAYTSGQNELLSNPFHKIRFHYFEAVKSEEKDKNSNLATLNRLFFIDPSANFIIFISNMLLAERKKLEIIKSTFHFHDLHSFRLTFNLVDLQKKQIQLNKELDDIIEKLKLCATTWIEIREKKEFILILDFKVNKATKEAFAFHFKNSFVLFNSLYDLECLNLHLVAQNTRKLILNSNKSLNLSDEMPKPDPSRLFFRIEKIKLLKQIKGNLKELYYKSLSDGEHQFNEVVGSIMMMEENGCLFLFDEPDTHFNPLWRAKLIEIINKISMDDSKIIRPQEILLTTHSPYIIGDTRKENVYKFQKSDGDVTFENPKIETYGASMTLIQQEIFDREISISDFSNLDLEELRNSLKILNPGENLKDKIQKTKMALTDFGESLEKFDLYNFLRQKETEIKR